jgi:nitrate/nitrite transport system ATP-binding protein
MKNEHAFIKVEHADMVFNTKKGHFHALADVNLTVCKGEFITLIGHSWA